VFKLAPANATNNISSSYASLFHIVGVATLKHQQWHKILSISKLFFVLSALSVICITSIFPSCSTANLSDVKICSSINGSDCNGDVSSFPGDIPVIYCSANLKNAPSDTKVTFEWKHDGESFVKGDVNSGGGFVHSAYKPPSTFPPGKYTVTVKIAADNSAPVTKEFTIEE